MYCQSVGHSTSPDEPGWRGHAPQRWEPGESRSQASGTAVVPIHKPSVSIYKDARIRSVQWRDLVQLKNWEVVGELTLSLPWLLGSWFFFDLASKRGWSWMAAALFCSFYFFLTGLRQTHNAHHYAIGISRRAHEWVMFVMSLLMMASMHAVQVTHLHHHRDCLGPTDVEASSARLPWWKAILLGPLFPLRLHWHGLRMANSMRRRLWILAEVVSIGAAVAIVFFQLDLFFLKAHVAAMLVGECGTGFFAVWTVHHDCDERHHIGRTQRGWKNVIAYNMFFHIEHHLFPAVPTCHLPELARRLDEAAPELKVKKVY